MFSNRFNTKNDPLLEAVKGAMQDGDLRRQAVALVNEAFGVYNRNAVIREELAEYDAIVEEVYAELKEGNKENKEKKKEHEEKTGFDHIKKMGGFPGQSLKRTARSLTKEGNDGNLANNYPPYDKVTRGDVIAGATGKDQMGGKRKTVKEELKGNQHRIDANKNNKIDAQDFKLLRSKKRMNEGMMDPNDPSVQGSGDVTSTPAKKPVAKKAPNDPSVQGSSDVTSHGKPASIREGTKIVSKGYGKVQVVTSGKKDKTFKDPRDAKMYVGKKTVKEEEQIDEISKDLAHRYVKKSIRRLANAQSHADRAHLDHEYDNAKRFYKKVDKRQSGIDNALNKLSGKAKVQAREETISELNRSTLVSYIRKAAKSKATPENISKRGKGMEMAAKKIEKLEELSQFGSAFAAARKSGQSNFSFGGKSFNTKLASSSSSRVTPTMGRTPEAAASRTSGSSLPSMASATPAKPAPVGKRDFATTLGRDVGSGPDIKADAPKPPVDKYSFGQNMMNPPKTSSSTPATPAPSTSSVERGGSSNPPGASTGDVTPKTGGAITQDAQRAQATTQDAGTPKPSARLQRIGESVDVGSNKYRIV